MPKLTRRMLLAASAAMLLSAPVMAQEALPIGFIMPTKTLLGKQAVQAAEIAAAMINAKGGVLGGRQIKLVVYDDNQSVADGAAAAQRAIEQDGAKFVGGSFSSSVALAIIPIAQAEGALYMASMPKSADVSKTGYDAAFMLNTTASEDSAALETLFSRVKPTTVAYLGEDSDFGRQFGDTVKELTEAAGGKVVFSDIYDTKQADFSSLVTLVKASNADTFVTMGGMVEQTANIQRAAHEIGYRPRNIILGPGIMNTNVVKLAGEAAEGSLSVDIYLPNFENELNKKFVAAYEGKYGVKPEKTDALSFETIWLLASAIDKAGTDDVPTVAKTLRENEWDSPLGKIRFTPEGRVNVPAIVIGIKNGKVSAQ